MTLGVKSILQKLALCVSFFNSQEAYRGFYRKIISQFILKTLTSPFTNKKIKHNSTFKKLLGIIKTSHSNILAWEHNENKIGHKFAMHLGINRQTHRVLGRTVSTTFTQRSSRAHHILHVSTKPQNREFYVVVVTHLYI